MREIKPTGIYSADEIAELFGTSKRYVRHLLVAGELLGRKVSKRWYSTGAALLAFLNYPSQQVPGERLQHSQYGADTDWTTRLMENDPPASVDANKLAQATNNHSFSIQNAINRLSALERTDDIELAPSSSPATSVAIQIEREVAVNQAWQDANNDIQAMVRLLNQRMRAGGPAPARGKTWTKEIVTKLISYMGLQHPS